MSTRATIHIITIYKWDIHIYHELRDGWVWVDIGPSVSSYNWMFRLFPSKMGRKKK